MKSIERIKISAFALVLMAASGCALDEPPESEPSKIADEPAALDRAWTEVSPGVFLSDDGETRRWRITGVEGHATFMEEIRARLHDSPAGEEQGFYQRVLDGLAGSVEYASQHPDEATYKARDTEVSITDLTNGLRAYAHADRGWGYVAAEVYVDINGNIQQDRKSKSDTCISNCSVTVQKEYAISFPPSTCLATAYAAAGGTTEYIERTFCPITCTPRSCEWYECGYVGNGCGGTMYCGACPCVCGDGLCEPSGGENFANCPEDCGGGGCPGCCQQLAADGFSTELCPIE